MFCGVLKTTCFTFLRQKQSFSLARFFFFFAPFVEPLAFLLSHFPLHLRFSLSLQFWAQLCFLSLGLVSFSLSFPIPLFQWPAQSFPFGDTFLLVMAETSMSILEMLQCKRLPFFFKIKFYILNNNKKGLSQRQKNCFPQTKSACEFLKSYLWLLDFSLNGENASPHQISLLFLYFYSVSSLIFFFAYYSHQHH